MELVSICLNGKAVARTCELVHWVGADVPLRVFLPGAGGKGGFGSMLRAIGAQIEKTTNKDACRDLSGRRLRDVNAEKKIREYIVKQAKRKEQEKRQRKEKLARLRRDPHVQFEDEQYFRTRSLLPEVVHQAVAQGLRSATHSAARSTSTVTHAPLTDPIDPLHQSTSLSVTAADVHADTDACATPSPAQPLKRKAETSVAGKKKLKPCLWLGIDEDVSSDEE